MNNFQIKEITNKNIEAELEKIGFDIAYRAIACDKFKYKTFKIFNLSLAQAHILKQTALTFGADCGVHKDILTAKVEKTDIILGGSYSQVKKICDKLKFQPFSMKKLAEEILIQLENTTSKTKLVGILNITPDSFSDGGKYLNPKDAIKQIYQLIEDGADIIDIGAESTRPNSSPVEPKVQIERLKPILQNISDIKIPISIDTRSSEVADFALNQGVEIINDVSGLNFDSNMINIINNYDAKIVIQHSTGNSENLINYADVVDDVYKYLYDKIIFAKEKGLKNIIVDPGIGFGKNKEDCFNILNRFEEFYSLKTPLMIGISRKSFLGLTETNDNSLKDSLSLALSYPLIRGNIDYLRVHNVKLHKQLLNSTI